MRGQSHVVGMALMLGLTVVALGLLTAGVGTVFDEQAASTDAQRVATDLDEALQPVATTGPRTGKVSFSDGRLAPERRQLRVLENGSVVAEVDVDALVYESDGHRATFVAGAVARGDDPNSWLVAEPPIAASQQGGVLVVGAPRLGVDHVAVAGERASTTLRTNVSHDRHDLGRGQFGLAIETTVPSAFEGFFERQNATVTRHDLDGDGVESVVATYPGVRQGYLAIHDMRLEVGNG